MSPVPVSGNHGPWANTTGNNTAFSLLTGPATSTTEPASLFLDCQKAQHSVGWDDRHIPTALGLLALHP